MIQALFSSPVFTTNMPQAGWLVSTYDQYRRGRPGAIAIVDNADFMGELQQGLERHQQESGGQQDAGEFLQILTETYPDFFRTILSTITHPFRSRPGQATRRAIERLPYLVLQLGARTVEQALITYQMRRTHEGIQHEYKIQTPPPLLCLSFERNTLEGYDSRPIQYSQRFTLGRMEYTLGAVLVHRGTVSRGHYLSCVFYQNSWHRCDDLSLTPISVRQVLNFKTQVYILFYHGSLVTSAVLT